MLLFHLLMVALRDIEIITRDNCGFSEKMRNLLLTKKLHFTEKNTSKMGGKEKIFLIKGLSNDTTFPAVFIDGAYVGGYSDVIARPEMLTEENLGD